MSHAIEAVGKLVIIAGLGLSLSACGTLEATSKFAAAPVKIVYKGGELGVKGAYQTGKFAAVGTYQSGKLMTKGAYEVGELGAKGVYYTGKYTGKGVLGTLEMTGNGLVKSGHGLYYMGTVPLKVTESALSTASGALTITVRVLDAAGRVVELKKNIEMMALSSEIQLLKSVPNLVDVLLDSGGSQLASVY